MSNLSKSCWSTYIRKAPLIPIPVIETPFQIWGMDIIGPLTTTDKQNRFALTVVDYATRYPVAYPLRNITCEDVAECLLDLISSKGIPAEIVSDCGVQFTGELLQQVCESLGIKQIYSSVYHPECNRLVERFNGSIKVMLRKLSLNG